MRTPTVFKSILTILCIYILTTPNALGSSEKEELIIWGRPFQYRGYRAAIKKFEKAHPNIRVVASIAGRSMDDQKLMCGIVGGSPPDVMWQDRFTIADWTARGSFYALNDMPLNGERVNLIERDRDEKYGVKPEEYYKACWEEVVYQGKVCAIPLSVDNRALYYNKDLLKRAALTDSGGRARPPRTWNELKEYAIKITARDSENKLTRVGFIPNFGNSWLYMYGWQNGGKFMSDDRRTCTLNDPRIVEALEFMVDIYDSLGGVEEVDAFSSTFQGGTLDPFYTGKVAMKIDGDWVLQAIAEHAPNLNFGVAPAPIPENRLPNYISWSGGFSLAIPVGARHIEDGWELIKWITSKEAAMIIHGVEDQYRRSRGVTYIPSKCPNERINNLLYEEFVAHNDDISKDIRDAYKVFVDLMKVSKFRPVTPVGQKLWDEHADAFEYATHHEFCDKKEGKATTKKCNCAKIALDNGARNVQRDLDLILKKKVYPEVNWLYPAAIFSLPIFAGVIIFLVKLRNRQFARRVLRRETAAGLMFAIPWFVGIIVFTAGPILVSIVFSFCEYDVIHSAKFVGVDNYKRMFTEDPLFWKSLYNTIFMVLGVPLGMAVSLAIAMLLNAKIKGMTVYRTIYYLPAIVPAVASSVLWIWVLNPTNGLINTSLNMLMGIDGPKWLQSVAWSKPSIILMGLWGAGAGMIIWLAGLKGIPEHLYEAAEIDGAGWFAKFIHVTLPMLSPYIFFNLIMGTIATFQIFTQAFIMTEGGPVNSTLFYVYALFNNAFRFFKMGYASAFAWILFIIILVLTIVQLKIAPRWVHYETE